MFKPVVFVVGTISACQQYMLLFVLFKAKREVLDYFEIFR